MMTMMIKVEEENQNCVECPFAVLCLSDSAFSLQRRKKQTSVQEVMSKHITHTHTHTFQLERENIYKCSVNLFSSALYLKFLPVLCAAVM